jgi:hypothetical protein
MRGLSCSLELKHKFEDFSCGPGHALIAADEVAQAGF